MVERCNYAPVTNFRNGATRNTTANTTTVTTAMMPLFLRIVLFMGGSPPETGGQFFYFGAAFNRRPRSSNPGAYGNQCRQVTHQ